MKKIYLVPNIVTTANMFCGFYSIVASHHGEHLTAAWAIIVAGIFDMLDGRIARLARATSSFGVEYDSLSDLISFGVAPAFLIYTWALEPYGRLGWLAAFLFVACGALRLARFNVMGSEAPKSDFQGLPIPGAAGGIASFIILQNETSWPGVAGEPVTQSWVLGMALALSSLMVSTVRFSSFKEFNWRSRARPGYFLIGVLALVLLAVKPEITLFGIFFLYVFGNLIWNSVMILLPILRKESKRRI